MKFSKLDVESLAPQGAYETLPRGRSQRTAYRGLGRTVLTVLVLGLPLFVGCRLLSPKQDTAILAPAPPPTPLPSEGTTRPPALILGNTPASPAPVEHEVFRSYRPPQLVMEAPPTGPPFERTEAFRPIVPESLKSDESVSVVKIPTEPPRVDPAMLEKVEMLNRRVAELEQALAKSEEQLRQSPISLPLPNSSLQEQASPESPVSTSMDTDIFPAVTTPENSPSDPLGLKNVQENVPPLPRPVPKLNLPGVTASSDTETVRIEVTDQALFEHGTWKINPEAEESLRKIAGEIRAIDPKSYIEIEGHTDNLETDPGNTTQKHDVSAHKAVVVMQYFIHTLRWDQERIRMSSHGANRPVADNGTPEGRIRNNRIEIVVLPKTD